MEGRKFAVCCLLLSQYCLAAAMRHLVYWDKEKIPSLVKQGLMITVEVNDWMDVLCPYFANLDSAHQVPDRNVFLYIYNVTEKEFANCDTRRGRLLQDCDDPLIEKKLTTKFQERSPSPLGFVFRPGSTYYYVSKTIHEGSSTGCTANTLKMIIHVEEKGTVFAVGDPDTTKVYHNVERKETETTRPSATTTSSGHFKDPKRHHHHHHHHDPHAKGQTTSVPKPVFKVAASPSSRDADAKASRNVQKDDPGNFGHGSLRSSCALTSTVSALVSSLIVASVTR